MKRTLAFAVSAVALLGTASLAIAQQPAYGPNAVYYPGYTEPAAPPPPAYAPPPATYGPAWDGTHSGGGAGRAYSYWGAQKSN